MISWVYDLDFSDGAGGMCDTIQRLAESEIWDIGILMMMFL